MHKSFCIAASVTALLVVAHALADAGRVGQWRVVTESTLSDPNHILIDLPAAMAAAIKERSNTSATRYYCMSPAMVTATKVFMRAECTVGDTEVEGQSLSAAYQCSGENPGRGHITMTYDKPEHYRGEGTFTPADGGGLKIKSTIEGTWLADGCSAMGN